MNNNDTNECEAELVFQLDDVEVISGYEIDVDGRMVPAVVVPKEKARYLWGNIVVTFSELYLRQKFAIIPMHLPSSKMLLEMYLKLESTLLDPNLIELWK